MKNTKHPQHLYAALAGLLIAGTLRAGEHPVVFSPTDTGSTHSIANWGVNCLSTTDIQRDLLFMGSNTVNFVMVGFQANAPQTGTLTSSQLSSLNGCVNAAAMVPNASWVMSFDSGAGVDPWFQSGSGTVYPDRWAYNMEVWQQNYNHSLWWTMPFNEPDYGPWGEGSAQNLYDIMGYLQASTQYSSSIMAGGTTLNDDVAQSWYDTISSRAGIGTTHCLAGSVNSYVNFINDVLGKGGTAINPEAHNVVEAIMGANYGIQGISWWGPALRTRGDFATYCAGKQLAYGDDWGSWTAAAVYRNAGGNVEAFVGSAERQGGTGVYHFYSKDHPAFFDGNGPKRNYSVTVSNNMEKAVSITWGADAAPAVNGRYILVNRYSGLALGVPGASTNAGTGLDQEVYTGGLNQQWDVQALPANTGGDSSYLTIASANTAGMNVDDNNWSFADGNQLIQWNGGANEVEQWYLEYAGNGYFKIRSRWSHSVIGVLGASTASGAAVVQWHDNGSADQQWRLVPATVASYDFVAPAVPTGVTATPKAVSVALNWNANADSDLAGYTILRSTTSGGPYDIVARGLTTTSFVDGGASQHQAYYYVVAAVDKSLNQSAYSGQASATPSGAQARVANYNFENNVSDSSGNGNDAEVYGSPSYVTGKSGKAISLNGAGQYVLAPAGIMTGMNSFTIAGWVYWNGGSAWQRIFDFGNGAGQYMFLTPSSGSGTLRYAITTSGAGGEQIVETSAPATRTWVHIAVTYNGSTLSIYKNGALAASGAVSISPAAVNPMANSFGLSQYPADPTLNAKLDSIYLYNYALSSTQVSSLYHGTAP